MDIKSPRSDNHHKSEDVSNSLQRNIIVKVNKLNGWTKLVGINLLAFGHELCASAGFSYIPPIMLKKGFSESALTVIMGIGPFLSLLLVPFIGHCSDRCTSQFGRRRPFLLLLGIFIFLSLLMIPFSAEIETLTCGIIGDPWALTFGIILLDFSSQAIMNPCKALIPDILETNEQNSGFTAYSSMLSLGGCTGYLISSVDWVDTSLGISFGGQEKVVFCVLAICIAFLLVLNLYFANEIPLKEEVDKFSEPFMGCSVKQDPMCHISHTNGSLNITLGRDKSSGVLHSRFKFYSQSVKEWWKSQSSIWCNLKCHTKYLFCCFVVPKKLLCSFKTLCLRFLHVPQPLYYLFLSSLFGWMAMSCHDLYFTDFVGQVIYQGKPKADLESASLNLYNQGVRMGSWALLLQCLSASIYAAFIQEHIILLFGQCKAYLFGITLFSLSLIGTVFTNSILLVNILTAISGTGLAAITSVPYTLVTDYYNSQKHSESGFHGIGEDMAVLDSAYYLSQIIPSLFLGYIVDLTGTSSTYMLIAALCSTVACYFSIYIQSPLSQ